MGIKKGLLAFILLAAVAGCYNDGQLLEQLSNQEQRLAALDRTCAQMNTNIASLQAILQALQDNDYVTSVAPISQAGEIIG